MAFSIPGLNTLYAIFKRGVDVKNNRLEYRRTLAKELYENCHEWSQLLVQAFDCAVARWEEEGRKAAEDEIMDLEMDFHKLNYFSLKEDSPIIIHLLADHRFRDFAEACCEFYKSALGVKRIVYGDIKNRYGEYVSSYNSEISEMVSLWKDEVERMIEQVTYKWMEVQTLEKK